MLILGSKACELEILAQPTLIQESTVPFSIFDKKGNRPVDFEAHRKAEIDLNRYLDDHKKAEQAKFRDIDYIEKNKQMAESRVDPYYVRYHKSMVKQEEKNQKHLMAKQRKVQIEQMKQKEAEYKRGRWDRYRDDREK